MFSFPLPLATAQSLRSVYMDWFVSEWVAGNPRSAMIPAGTWINYHYLGRVEWDKRGRRFCERKGIRVRQRHAGDPRRVITIHLKITYHNSFFKNPFIFHRFLWTFEQQSCNSEYKWNFYMSITPYLYTINRWMEERRGAYTLHIFNVGGTWWYPSRSTEWKERCEIHLSSWFSESEVGGVRVQGQSGETLSPKQQQKYGGKNQVHSREGNLAGPISASRSRSLSILKL